MNKLLYLGLYCLINVFVKAEENVTVLLPLNVCNYDPEKEEVELGPLISPMVLRLPLNASIEILPRNIGRQPICPENAPSKIFEWPLSSGDTLSDVTEKPNKENYALNISKNEFLRYNYFTYEENEYCVTEHDNSGIQFDICQKRCSKKTPCIERCCDVDEVLDVSGYPVTCRPSGDGFARWKPLFYHDFNNKFSEEEMKNLRPIYVNKRSNNWTEDNCYSQIISLKNFFHQRSLVRILEDGSVWKRIYRREWVQLTDNYCIDSGQAISGNATFYDENERNMVIYKCTEYTEKYETFSWDQTTIDFLYGVLLTMSSIDVYITLMVHSLMWKHKIIHFCTKVVQVCYVFFFFFVFLTLAIFHLVSVTITRSDTLSPICRHSSVLTHFYYLCAYNWLSVVNYDTWKMFRTLTTRPRKKDTQFAFHRVFLIILAPCAFITVGTVLDYIFRKDIAISGTTAADFGKLTCFLELHYKQIPYLYAPIIGLLIAILVYFALLSRTLYAIQISTNENKEEGKTKIHPLLFYSKFSILLGIPWLVELISYFSTPEYDHVSWYWILADLLLVGQSLLIYRLSIMDTGSKRRTDV